MENKKFTGRLPSIFGIVFSLLGIFTLGFVFVPLAFILTLISLFLSIRAKDWASFFIAILSGILIIIGYYTSPMLQNLFS